MAIARGTQDTGAQAVRTGGRVLVRAAKFQGLIKLFGVLVKYYEYM